MDDFWKFEIYSSEVVLHVCGNGLGEIKQKITKKSKNFFVEMALIFQKSVGKSVFKFSQRGKQLKTQLKSLT